jgi:hypothetical protein
MKHKYETTQNTGVRAFTMPLVIGSSSLHGIKGQVVVCTCRSVVFNRALEAAPAEQTGQAAADWMQEYGSRNKDCLEWSDTCANCVRAQSGENFSCSNIGIACQPKDVKCDCLR